VVNTLAARPSVSATLAQKQQLAAVIHLCGSKRGQSFAARGFRLRPGDRCGTHSLRRYLRGVDLMKNRFAQLRGASKL
jgi:hypothetical protein